MFAGVGRLSFTAKDGTLLAYEITEVEGAERIGISIMTPGIDEKHLDIGSGKELTATLKSRNLPKAPPCPPSHILRNMGLDGGTF